MDTDNIPIFEDEKEKKYMEKARLIAQEEINKQHAHNTQKSISDKVRRIKDQFDKPENDDVHEKHVDISKTKNKDITCPGCHNHDLNVHNNIAKCTGKDCNKEYLLSEKNPKDKKDYMCLDCGFTISKKDAVKMSEDNKNCPLCNQGDKFLEIEWNILNKRKK